MRAFPFEDESELPRRLADDPLAPVLLPSGDEALVAVRHADVRQVYGDPRFSRELHYPGAPRLLRGTDVGDDPSALINMDPPRHTRLRRLASVAFTPRRIAAWRPRAQQIADDLVDVMSSPSDLVTAFAFPLPLRIITELLGVPHEDWDRFRAWSDAFLSTSDQGADERAEAGRAFARYVAGLIASRREHPSDGLLDALVQARDGGEAMSERELMRMIVGLIIAGHETTATVIARGALTLLAEPARFAALAAAPEAVPPAVEEILRWHVPGDGGMLRVALEDVDLPSGRVAKGQAVMTSSAAANRDPEAFADPDRFDMTRPECPHLTFGQGPHYCLGANLARMELQVAFETLARRLPTLALAAPPELHPLAHRPNDPPPRPPPRHLLTLTPNSPHQPHRTSPTARAAPREPRRAAPRRAAPGRAGPRRAAPRRAAPGRAGPRRAGPRRAGPRRAGPRRANCAGPPARPLPREPHRASPTAPAQLRRATCASSTARAPPRELHRASPAARASPRQLPCASLAAAAPLGEPCRGSSAARASPRHLCRACPGSSRQLHRTGRTPRGAAQALSPTLAVRSEHCGRGRR
ncbi:cytochrome P450 [Actinomadura rupiterrae]|uniref:cytochrome P450 n=1 Tax=Actinomadura rupiterrae TaxID=559627 RepID=UPI0020A45911|nr:cytochrome P450 [Actinomadura rupiterrae]MCP2338239.1 cytochrome P450 [Actinomadura rupiterrae]